MTENKPLFTLGIVVATPGAMEAMARADQAPAGFLRRHLALEQGELDAGDHWLNRQALKDGSRIFSSFKTSLGERLWVITEGVGDDEGRRHSTCILTPEEY